MEVENLKAILDTYGKAFGQLINLNKSEFSSFSQTKAITRTMSKRLQEDWARAAEEGPSVLMNLRVDF